MPINISSTRTSPVFPRTFKTLVQAQTFPPAHKASFPRFSGEDHKNDDDFVETTAATIIGGIVIGGLGYLAYKGVEMLFQPEDNPKSKPTAEVSSVTKDQPASTPDTEVKGREPEFRKEEKVTLSKQSSATPSQASFLSMIPLEAYADLPSETKQFMVHLASGGKRRGAIDPQLFSKSDSIINLLSDTRKAFLQRPEDDDSLNIYIPESSNSGSQDEAMDLNLEEYPLQAKPGQFYPDLRQLKDICLAQQIYSCYLRNQDQANALGAFSKLIKNAFGEGYKQRTKVRQLPLQWIKEAYQLYDGPFDLERTLAESMALEKSRTLGLEAIIGYEDLKKRLIQAIFAPLIFPAINSVAPSKVQKGWILHGESGTGKSHGAKQIAHQLGLRPIEVDLSRVGSSYENQTIRNLKEKFEIAHRLAKRHGASVMIMDEMNQLGDSRKRATQSGKQDLTNSLLNLLTRYVEDSNENLIVIGTTNDLESLDRSITRDGRLGNIMKVDVPDEKGRHAFLESTLPDRVGILGDSPYEGGRSFIISHIVKSTEGMPIASLKALCNELTSGYNSQITVDLVNNYLNAIKENKQLR